MKLKSLIAGVVAASLAVVMPAAAVAATAQYAVPPNYAATNTQPGGAYSDMSFVGLDKCVQVNSAAAKSCASGAGILFGAYFVNNPAGYVAVFDTTVATTVGSSDSVSLLALVPSQFLSGTASFSPPGAQSPSGNPRIGLRFTKGLQFAASSATGDVILYFVTDAELAPAQ